MPKQNIAKIFNRVCPSGHQKTLTTSGDSQASSNPAGYPVESASQNLESVSEPGEQAASNKPAVEPTLCQWLRDDIASWFEAFAWSFVIGVATLTLGVSKDFRSIVDALRVDATPFSLAEHFAVAFYLVLCIVGVALVFLNVAHVFKIVSRHKGMSSFAFKVLSAALHSAARFYGSLFASIAGFYLPYSYLGISFLYLSGFCLLAALFGVCLAFLYRSIFRAITHTTLNFCWGLGLIVILSCGVFFINRL